MAGEETLKGEEGKEHGKRCEKSYFLASSFIFMMNGNVLLK